MNRIFRKDCPFNMCRIFLLVNAILLAWVSALLISGAHGDSFSRYRQKVPRIGRRDNGVYSEIVDADSYPYEGSLSSFFLKSSKSVPRLGRRNNLNLDSKESPYDNWETVEPLTRRVLPEFNGIRLQARDMR